MEGVSEKLSIEPVFPFVIGNENVPAIAKKIFDLLDQKTLLKARGVCKEWKQQVDEKTSFWSLNVLLVKVRSRASR